MNPAKTECEGLMRALLLPFAEQELQRTLNFFLMDEPLNP